MAKKVHTSTILVVPADHAITDVFKTTSSLDTSLRKNTAVIKRLRTSITSEQQSALIKDIQSTSLEKYLPEVVSAVEEGLRKSKISDTAAIIEVVSALHQRFQKDFTPRLVYGIARGLAIPKPDVLADLASDTREREEKERLARQRSLLRIAVELWLVGVVRTMQDVAGVEDGGKIGKLSAAAAPRAGKGSDEPFPLEILKALVSRDKEHNNLPLMVLFAKQFSYDVLGLKPRSSARKIVAEDGGTNQDSLPGDGPNATGPGDVIASGDHSMLDSNDHPFVVSEIQQRFRNILMRYLEDIKAHVVREHKHLQTQSARNAEAYIRSGEIFEDRQSNYEKQVKAQEKFVTNVQTIADIMGAEMPDLPDEKDEEAAKGSIIREGSSMFTGKGDDEGKFGIWEDEEQKKFYEDIVDLKVRVPPILLEDGKKKRKESEIKPSETGKKLVETGNIVQEQNLLIESPEPEPEEDKEGHDDSTAIANKAVGAQVDAFLVRLPESTNREMIDQAAIEFCFLNSKASRNRLIKVLQDVPRSRQDLLPYYSRLVATLSRYLPDVGKGVVEHLDKEFRSLQRRKEKDLSESRAKNARYLSELTKFGVVPQHLIFHCLKVAIDDFHRMNIEIMCHVLENCGRYLLRTQETGPRMAVFLDTLKKKKDAVQYLGPQERVAIENAFYYVNPPERPAIVQKHRSIMELHVRKLIYLDLTKRNYVKILKQLRKLHWEDQELVAVLKKVFTKVWKVRYNNIHLLAIIVGALSRYHQSFAFSVIDEILEQISAGLEENNFKHNQRRIAQVKYLGELYNYKMVDSPVIFDALYRIVTFGYEGGMPRPGRINQLDQPDDFFRIRLVCALLDACGSCFDRGSAKRKLDFFLNFFQYYLHTKDDTPMDIDFLVQDTFAELRPTWKPHNNLEEAGKAFEEAVAQTYHVNKNAVQETDETYGEDSESEDADDVELREEDGDGQLSDGEEEDMETITKLSAVDESVSESESEDENIVVTREEEQLDPEAEADFDREFVKMMQESLDSRKFERKPVFDVPLPIRKGGTLSSLSREATFESEAGDAASLASTPITNASDGTMMFSLLTKRGNRQQTKSVALPSDSGFAVAMRNKQEAEREEKQKIKELVMSYDRSDDNDNDLDGKCCDKQ